MKTDPLFYRLFQIDPSSLFRLVNIDIQGDYRFESVTIKNTEKRIDGLFRSVDGTNPDVFLEIQGYDDPKIYWRFFREICSYQEQSEYRLPPFIAVLLFLDDKYKPGDSPFACVAPYRFICANLIDELKKIWHKPSPLTVLKPFLVKNKKELYQSIRQWENEIRSLQFEENKTESLIELLEYAILEKFPKLSIKEVQAMLQLTPLEKTRAVQELLAITSEKKFIEGIEKGREKGRKEGIQKGRKEGIEKGIEKGRKEGIQKGRKEGIEKGIEKGRKEGIQKGELIGKIQLTEKLLKRVPESKEELSKKGITTLKKLFQKLEVELNLQG
ncbi:MAG: DUF2887 domain-containing protein [Desulfobacterales bacterium]|nr:DUF2887 domain-containing protein [Desulfobacterales bacterium]